MDINKRWNWIHVDQKRQIKGRYYVFYFKVKIIVSWESFGLV